MKTVIIGGVASGMSAASKLKRLDPLHEVVVIEKGAETSYGACGLPYYISGVNPEEDLLRIRKPHEFEASGIILRMRCEVTQVDFKAKKVRYSNLMLGEEFTEYYDHLVIACGAEAVIPPLPGCELKGIFTLKTIEDANQIKGFITTGIKSAVVVGGGYIGIEIVDNLLRMGIKVELIEAADRILSTFDREFSDIVLDLLRQKGVGTHLNETVKSFEGTVAVRGVITEKGSYPADIAFVAVGVRPSTAFLAGSGLKMLPNGAIEVNRKMKTSVPNVWAAGDCATVWHRILKKNIYSPLATNANKQGRYAAENIMGAGRMYNTAIGTAMIKVGDLELGRTGLGEEEAIKNGIDCMSVMVTGIDHAPYYPDSKPITVKLIFRKKTGVIIGAQLIGEHGAALRTDVMAACITAGIDVARLGEMDFGYAPPYAMPWDILHVAANVAESKLVKE